MDQCVTLYLFLRENFFFNLTISQCKLIQVYAATAKEHENETESFDHNCSQTLRNYNKKDNIIIMGNFNSKLGNGNR